MSKRLWDDMHCSFSDLSLRLVPLMPNWVEILVVDFQRQLGIDASQGPRSAPIRRQELWPGINILFFRKTHGATESLDVAFSSATGLHPGEISVPELLILSMATRHLSCRRLSVFLCSIGVLDARLTRMLVATFDSQKRDWGRKTTRGEHQCPEQLGALRLL